MSPVDLVLIVLLLLFAVSGYRQGFVVGVLSFVGFFGGALLGLQLAPLLVRELSGDTQRVLVSLLTIFGLAVVCQVFAGWVGSRLRGVVRSKAGRRLDDVGGALVSVVAVSVVAWLVAVPLSASSTPGLNRAVNDSAVLGAIDHVMPESADTLSHALRDTIDQRDFPEVFGALTPTRVPAVEPPDEALAVHPVVGETSGSVVKVHGDASGCARRIEGSGFAYAPEYVMTNAHVVAGTEAVTVAGTDGRHDGQVVHYDPQLDLAVVHAPGLAAPALPFADDPVGSGADAIVLGFPMEGPFDAQQARVRERRTIHGPDIYDRAEVDREVYAIRALVRSGNSGGPLLAPSGDVLGVIFAAAADDPRTGFAVTATEALPVAESARGLTDPVDTGPCA